MQKQTQNLSWWRRCSSREKCLILISSLFLIIVIGLLIGLVSVISSNQTEEVCLTTECVHTASTVLRKMNPKVNPCDDFYQFTCGSYIDEQIIPEDEVDVDTFSEISDKVQEQLRDIISVEPSTREPKHFRLPIDLYKACMNETLIESLSTSTINKLTESLGGWPVIKGNAWDLNNTWSWQDTTKKLRQLGFDIDTIFDLSVSDDNKNTTRKIISIDQASFSSLSPEYLCSGFNETFVVAYYEYMVGVAVLLGAEKKQAAKELKESLQFEMDLAKISWLQEKRRNPNDLYNLRTIKELQQTYPFVEWLDYINALLPKQLMVNENETINVLVPTFFNNLSILLANTPKRVIANHMLWSVHAWSIDYLSLEFRKLSFKFDSILSGIQEREARWKECVDTTRDLLPISVGSHYVRKHFKEDSKAVALEMVNNIRNVFNNIIDEVDWMDALTKQAAKKKLHSMTTHIGYPDEILDNDKLANYYSQLHIDPNKYLESVLNIYKFSTDYDFGLLRQPVNKTYWVNYANPTEVNAIYSSVDNSIEFPAGILQGHCFSAQRPKYMNYGAIGWFIGHEITHGFDDEGRLFDLNGNLVDWWQPDTKKAFLDKVKCIIEQYGNFTDKLTGLNLNGINTQGENIGDNGGIKQSYIAYEQWASEHGPEPKLPGLDFTPEQMFWITVGQTSCKKIRKESLKDEITVDVHSPSEFRVLGPLRNMKDFAKDFQCPEGAPMNPVHKCEVW